MIGFKEKLMQQFHFSLSDWEITKDYFSIEIIDAKQHFLKLGQISDKLGFLKSGLLRSYYYDEEGRDITSQFFQPGSVVISVDSFNNRTPVKEYIIAYEKSELIVITYDNLHALYKKVPLWQQICKDVADIKNKRLLDRAAHFQTLTAAKRYHTFCKENPGLILKVPVGHIASYLGMDIATLSRLRAKR